MKRLVVKILAGSLMALTCVAPRLANAEGGTIAGAVTVDGKNDVKGFKLQEAVIFLKSKAPAAEAAPSGQRQVGGTINQKDKVYVPHVIAIPAGTVVEFHNEDAELHNVHSESTENPEFNAASVPGAAPIKKFFPKAEVVKLTCNVHPDMLAYIVVCPDSHFAAASTSGEYSISGVPAGEYTITLWHERFEPVTQDVTVKDGQTLAVNFPLERSKAIRRH